MAVCPRVGQADKAPVSLLTHLNTIFLKAKKGQKITNGSGKYKFNCQIL